VVDILPRKTFSRVEKREAKACRQFEAQIRRASKRNTLDRKSERDIKRVEAQSLFGIGINHNFDINQLIPTETINSFASKMSDAFPAITWKSVFINAAICIRMCFKHWNDLESVTWSIVSFLGTLKLTEATFEFLKNYCLSAFKQLIDWFNSKSVKAQTAEDLFETDVSKLDLSLLCGILGGPLTAIFTAIILYHIPGGNSFDKVQNRFSKMGGCIKSYNELAGLGDNFFSEVIESVRVNVFGCDKQKVDAYETINHWTDEVFSLIPSFEQRLRDDSTIPGTVDMLLDRGFKILKDFDAIGVPQVNRGTVQTCMLTLFQFRDKAAGVSAGQDASRVPPVVAHFYGASGVGKSTMLACLSADINIALGVTGVNEINQATYYRQPGQKFWDGYKNAVNVAIYDDFGAVVDNEMSPNEEFLEMIRTSNTAAYPLNMADLRDKGHVYFKAPAVLLTSNRPFYAIKSLTNPEAVIRRIDSKFRVYPRPEYAKLDEQNGKQVEIFDREKMIAVGVNDNIMDCVLFDKVDNKTQIIRRGMTYREVSDEIVSKVLGNINFHGTFETALSNYVQSHPGVKKTRAQVNDVDDDHLVIADIDMTDAKQRDLDHTSPANLYGDLRKATCVRTRTPELFKRCYKDAYYTSIMHNVEEDLSIQIFDRVFREQGTFCEFTICNCSPVDPALLARALKSNWKDLAVDIKETVMSWATFESLASIAKFSFGCLTAYLLYKFSRQIVKFFYSKFGINIDADNYADYTGKSVKVIENYDSNKTPAPKVKKLEAKYDTSRTVSKNVKHVEMCPFARTESPCCCIPRGAINDQCYCSAEVYDNSKTPAQRVRKVESNETTVPAQAVNDPNAAEIVAKMYRNMYKLEYQAVDDKWYHAINLLIVKGRLAVTNRHILGMEHYSTWRIRNVHKPDGIPIDLWSCPQALIPDSDIHGLKDVMMFELPRVVDQHPDITSKFMTVDDFARFTALKTISLIGHVPSDQVILRQYFSDSVRAVDADISFAATSYTTHCRQYFEYGIQTVNGDCGGVLVAFDKNFNNKIIGIHAGGEANTKYCGFGTPVSSQLIRKLESLISCKPDSKMFPSECADFELDVSNIKVNDTTYDWKVMLPFSGNFNFLGNMTKRVFAASQSAIMPSPVYGVIAEPTMKPAHLSPFKNEEGEVIDPMAKARAKASPVPFLMDSQLLDSSVYHFTQLITSDVEETDRRVLSYEEAIAGIDGDECYRGINRQTSPGYGWEKSGVGKQKWLGCDDYDFSNKALLIKYNEVKEKCKVNRPTTFWIDTLKDERRPIAKVDAGKTRLFSVGEMAFTILFRQYFLGFVAHMMRHKIDYESCVGLNVYSREWTRLAMKLNEVGQCVIAGDFGNYDGTLNAELLWRVLDVIESFYQGTEEEKQIRRAMWSEIVYSIHLNGNSVYSWTHSQPSGCPMTTILNCCYHSISARYVYLVCALKHKPELASLSYYTQYIRHFNYGDDDAWNISHEIIDWFNQVTITEAYATFGMEYTDEAKSGVIVPYRTRDEINFLKRNFEWDNVNCRFRAPLSLETIREMAMWNRKTIDQYQLTADVLQEAVHELSLHKKEVFDRELPNFERARVIVSKNTPCFFQTYEEYGRIENVLYASDSLKKAYIER